MSAFLTQIKPVIATEAEAALSKRAGDSLANVSRTGDPVQLVMREAPQVVVPIPARVIGMMLDILQAMARRQPVSIIPSDAELTTQQAADYLNVSRPFLVGLIDRGELPHRKVGRHRRVRFADLLAFEEASMLKRRTALAALAEEEKRLGLE